MTGTEQRPCRVCAAPIAPFMTFGSMPIANGFLDEADIATEYRFELAPAFCESCATFQLYEQPSPARLFHDQYPFFSSSSQAMAAHFDAFAASVRRRLGARPALVVEIGSNDGTLLQHFNGDGCRGVGVEPAANVAAVARARGLETIEAFFGRALAESLRSQHGPADAIVAANVICHIPDVQDFAAGVAALLSDEGVLVFEDPYVGDMLAKRSYDQIYDEHVFMWSATSVANAIRPHGLELIDVEAQPTHGGSMRYVCGRAGRHPISAAVAALRQSEEAAGICSRTRYDQFRVECEAARDQFRSLLLSLREQGRTVAGYAATSKSTTLLNYCGIDRSLIAYIADTTPLKQGKVTPGSHIPVVSPDVFLADPPEFAVLFAWNHAAEVMAKQQAFTAGGGKWITFVPDVAILDASGGRDA